MDARVRKLRLKGLSQQDAVRLVHAKLGTPAAIKKATDEQLKAIPGVGEAKVKELRERFPKTE